MICYLSVKQVLFLHDRLIEETGGRHGVRDLTLLESAIARPKASYGGKELHPDLITKAAALLDALARNHPFVDGNKRTSIAVAALFLQLNGRVLTATNPELEHFTSRAVIAKLDLVEIAAWLRRHTRRRSSDKRRRR